MSISSERTINLPHAGLVVLVGASNSGKTTLLDRLVSEGILLKTEVVSSDHFRQLVGDTEFIDWSGLPRLESDVLFYEYQQMSAKAFEAMDTILAMRCRLNKLTVVDATHLYAEDRQKYVQLAAKAHVPVMALVLDVPESVLLERDAGRAHPRGRQRVKQQAQLLKRNLRGIREEGFNACYVLKDVEKLNFARRAQPLFHDIGAGIDIIGDIHGCYREMLEVLERLGYMEDTEGLYHHPEGRRLVSVGDVMSRGPASLLAVQFWKKHVDAGLAYMIDSNHGWKIGRYLDGRKVTLNHGDERFAEELVQYEQQAGKAAAEQLRGELRDFLLHAPSHLIFGRNGLRHLVVTHAGIKDHFIGKQSARISDYCRYGDTDGQDADGKPIRKDWFVDHESGEIVVWGHDPRPQPTIVNQTVNIDQGVVFGGMLTAYRYPEKEFVSVPAHENYANDPDSPLVRWQKKRFSPPNLRKLIAGYSVLTESYGEVRVQGEWVKSAIDTVSHVTVPMEELVYIPPTMSPAPTGSAEEGYLEHPREALAYYRGQGLQTMVAEKKHMGSRAILLLFKNEQAAVEYVGYPTLGTIYSRSGRPFFGPGLAKQVLEKLNADLQTAGYFERNQTDFVLLDAEIVPWNLKARELIAAQYAHVGEAALLDRSKLVDKLKQAKAAGREVGDWLEEMERKYGNAVTFQEAFQKYCWDVDGLDEIRIAPFHTLAHSGRTFFDQSHLWHMEHNRELAGLSSLFMETEYRVITDEASEEEVIRWWNEMTEDGHEGIVIKPERFLMKNRDKMIQPAIKVRGRKYLHIIYGMDYLVPENLKRLKQRRTNKKERHALMEGALGMEGVERFVRKDTVDRIHECVLAALSLESEPIDPRL
ncbi:polynucleotide kinase-phosphatase [Paenibacillus polymyxa]|uniref:polynucleotide kinase-phosphatase n=1 Tax=Paenibacillus polymyxa TaxID=1406 RepID=UPI0018672E90|nr:polynucleotide kinase-phosphatase [Paenibacillus polymyxa]MBE3650600.1 polynucleotide kinase-phosphatase [Paenibacillus polymyxa]